MPQDNRCQFMKGNLNCSSSAVESSWRGKGSSGKSTCFVENQNVVSNNKYWSRFHSYDPIAHEEKKKQMREFSKRNAYKGLHFRPSKYMQEEQTSKSSKQNMLLNQKKANEISSAKRETPQHDITNAHMMMIPLTHSFQVSSIQLESKSLISNKTDQKLTVNYSIQSTQFTHQNSRGALPSINEILSLSKIHKAPYKMTRNSNPQIISHLYNPDNFQLDNLTLAPFKLYH